MASGNLLIDDFAIGDLSLTVTPPQLTTSGNRAGFMTGGSAHHNLALLASQNNASGKLEVGATTKMRYSKADASVKGQATAEYGMDVNGLASVETSLNLDLTGYDRFRFTFDYNTADLTLNTVLRNFSPNEMVGKQTTIGAGRLVVHEVLFSQLGGSSGFTFADVDSMQFFFTTATGGDFQLQKIEAVPVPEPASLAVLAGLGLLAVRRRSRS